MAKEFNLGILKEQPQDFDQGRDQFDKTFYKRSHCFRPSSDVNLFMSRTHSNYSWAKLFNRLNWFRHCSKFQPNLIQKEDNAHFRQTAWKIHYNKLCIRFGTWKVWCLNQSHSKVTPKSKFLAGLGGKNGWAVSNWNRHWFRHQTFHILNSMY